MASLSTLKHKSAVTQSFDVRELLGEAYGDTLGALVGAGVNGKIAQGLLDIALEREQLAGYPPSSDERLDRARAALDTVVALYAPDVQSAGPVEISLAQIDVDVDVQIRVGGLNQDRVADYARDMTEGDEFPPVVVFFERMPSGGHRLWLADGFHRVAAARSNALCKTITARVEIGTHRDAAEYAATCNARHGLPMTNADKRAAVRRLLHFHSDLSSRELARRVGCSHPFVEAIRQEMAPPSTQEEPDTRTVQRGGCTYEYTPPPAPEYAEVWQIENCLANYLNVRFGRPGLPDFNAQPRIDCLQAMLQFDFDELPNGLHLPDHYRKGDLRQATNNVLEQVRQRERQRLEAKAAQAGDDGGSEEPPAEDTGTVVTWSPTIHPPASPADNVRGEPFYSALTKSASSTGLREALIGHDLDNPEALAALTRALVNIYGSQSAVTKGLASRIILDLIQDTIEDLQVELDFETPDGPVSPLEGGAVSETIGCPDCGGKLIRIINGGTERLVCEDCGATAEPEVLEAQGA